MSELFDYLSNYLEVTLGIVLLIVFVISIIKARGGKLTFFPAWLFPLLISTTIFLQVYKVVHFIFLGIILFSYLGYVWYNSVDVNKYFKGQEHENYKQMMYLASRLIPGKSTTADINKVTKLREESSVYRWINILGICAGSIQALFANPSLYDALRQRELLNQLMWTPTAPTYHLIIYLLALIAFGICIFFLIKDYANNNEKAYLQNFIFIISICIIRFAFSYQFTILIVWSWVLYSWFEFIICFIILMNMLLFPAGGILKKNLPNVEEAERSIQHSLQREREAQRDYEWYMASGTDHGSGGSGSSGGSGGGGGGSSGGSSDYDCCNPYNTPEQKVLERKGENCIHLDSGDRTCKLKGGISCRHLWNDTCLEYQGRNPKWD